MPHKPLLPCPEAAVSDAAGPAWPEPTPPVAPEAADEAAATFRVGAYEVGDGSCSELCGHPDILY